MDMTELLLFAIIAIPIIGFLVLPVSGVYKQQIKESQKNPYWDQTKYKD